MTVEGHILELELLFEAVLVDESGIQLSLTFEAEIVNFYLLCKIDIVLGHFFEHCFLGAPVDGQLLVPLVLIQVFDFVFGKSFLLDCGEIPVK